MDHLPIVAGRLRTDDRLKVRSPRNEEMNADALPSVGGLKLDHRRGLNERSVAEASDHNHRPHKANALRVPHSNNHTLNVPHDQYSNNRRLNVEGGGRFSHRRNPRRVRCHEWIVAHGLRHQSNVLRGRCNSNSRNHDHKRNVRRDPSSNGRRANALVVQPNDRNKTPSRNSRSIRVGHRLNVAVVAAARATANPVSRKFYRR
jgi:hypothetical protein